MGNSVRHVSKNFSLEAHKSGDCAREDQGRHEARALLPIAREALAVIWIFVGPFLGISALTLGVRRIIRTDGRSEAGWGLVFLALAQLIPLFR